MTAWRFTCYNGTVFTARITNLIEAINLFTERTGLHILNIKKIENLS